MKQNQNKVTEVKKVAAEKKNVPKISKAEIREYVNNNFHGRAIYKPSGKAAEYSGWACNLYNGCSHNCAYCYNNHSLMSATLGGTNVRLKASLQDAATAFSIFSAELVKCRDSIIKDGGLHFNFVSDPCLPGTIDLNWQCISFAINQGVPVQVLTKRADWLDHPAVQYALSCKAMMVRIGFSLTGCDALEPGASPNIERIKSMRLLHNAGIPTWASIEPIIYPQQSYSMIQQSLDCCDHYKIGVLSGKKDYTPQQIRNFVNAVAALNPRSVYWKQSIQDFVKKP